MGEQTKIDAGALEKFEAVMFRSQLDIDVLDQNGLRILSRTFKGETDRNFHMLKWDDGVEAISHAGNAYLRCDMPPIFALSTTQPRIGGIPSELFLCAALLEALAAAHEDDFSHTDVYRNALIGNIDPIALESYAAEYRIPLIAERCTVLFHTTEAGVDTVERMLQTLFPESSGDAVVVLDKHNVALVKTLDETVRLDELDQLAQAVEDSALTESGAPLLVGIGEPRKQLGLIHESLAEAHSAILIGRVFRTKDQVYNYRTLLLERLIAEIPSEAAARYQGVMFGKKYQRLLSEEMLNTIDMFFNCNLNLSEAARSLYIHRNTLVYRLDKFQRSVGLDLRNFDDAVTFRIMMMLRRAGDLHKAPAPSRE